jgi:hypothetical protein
MSIYIVYIFYACVFLQCETEVTAAGLYFFVLPKDITTKWEVV